MPQARLDLFKARLKFGREIDVPPVLRAAEVMPQAERQIIGKNENSAP